MLGKLTKDNINTLIAYTLKNISKEYVNIVTLCLRLASYSEINKPTTTSDFENIRHLVEKYKSSNK
jgi:hypothetical protein